MVLFIDYINFKGSPKWNSLIRFFDVTKYKCGVCSLGEVVNSLA